MLNGAPPAVRATYGALVDAGVVALNFATLVAFVLTGVLALRAARARRWAGGLLLALVVAGSIGASVAPPSAALTLAYLLASALVATCLIGRCVATARPGWDVRSHTAAAPNAAELTQRMPLHWRERAALIAFGVAYALLLAAKALPVAAQLGWGHGSGVGDVVQAAEGVTLLAIVLGASAWITRWSWRAAGAGVSVAILLAGAMLGMPEPAPLIGIWAFGLTFELPAVLYALGAGLAAATLVGALRDRRPLLAAALVLFLLSHRLLPLTYFNLLYVLAFALLAEDRVQAGATVVHLNPRSPAGRAG
ncbi:MAG: hypothetical protein FJ029_00925 [Actinobacteria bacterium]|nr:hypothetical protein [Actinomycetota bacterium]